MLGGAESCQPGKGALPEWDESARKGTEVRPRYVYLDPDASATGQMVVAAKLAYATF